MKLSGLEMSSE